MDCDSTACENRSPPARAVLEFQAKNGTENDFIFRLIFCFADALRRNSKAGKNPSITARQILRNQFPAHYFSLTFGFGLLFFIAARVSLWS